MRAAIVTTPGGPDAIDLVDLPDPVPASSEVVIRVEAAGVNPVDAQTRDGVYHRLGWVSSPSVGLGWDAVGTVIARGGDVDTVEIGTRVAVMIGGVDRPVGAYAERVAVAASDVAPVPDALSSPEAATVPLNATTASQALDLLGESAGRRLLITGAAGAVGGYALQLSRARGFVVTGLARDGDADFVRSTGATAVSTLSGDRSFDAVLDAAALDDEALAEVVDGGAYVGVVPIAPPASTRSIRVDAVMATPDGALLGRLLEAAARGELALRVGLVLPLSEAREAHRRLEAGGMRGRIVLEP